MLKVLGYHNKVLVEAVCKLILVDGPGVPPGAALMVGADGQVRLLLRLPFLAKVLLPNFSPVGLVLGKFENIPSKAMVDCYKANGHRATAGPLGVLAWEHYVGVQGTAAKGPCAALCSLLGQWEPGSLESLYAGHPKGLPPWMIHPPPRLGACPGAAQGCLFLAHCQ